MDDHPAPMRLSATEAARLLALPARPVYRPKGGLSRETRAILKPMAKRFGPDISELQLAWVQIVGEKLARLCAPQKITGGPDGQVLVVEAQGPVALALEAQSRQLLERLSMFAGAGRITRFRCVATRRRSQPAPTRRTAPRKGATPEELAALEAQLAHLPEGALKKAMRALGVGVLARNHDSR